MSVAWESGLENSGTEGISLLVGIAVVLTNWTGAFDMLLVVVVALGRASYLYTLGGAFEADILLSHTWDRYGLRQCGAGSRAQRLSHSIRSSKGRSQGVSSSDSDLFLSEKYAISKSNSKDEYGQQKGFCRKEVENNPSSVGEKGHFTYTSVPHKLAANPAAFLNAQRAEVSMFHAMLLFMGDQDLWGLFCRRVST
jgi:hypothetical protein